MHRALLLVAAAVALAGCTWSVEELPPLPVPPERPPQQLGINAPGSSILEDEEFGAPLEELYTLGPGDVVTVDVWAHEDLSGQHVVGPDGRITVPLVGSVEVRGLTRDAAAALVGDKLSPYYRNLAITLRVDEYRSNEIQVLGGVTAPGAYAFASRPTLLAALSRAGGVTESASGSRATRCAIVRDRTQIYWIDLRELLWNGNIALNVFLRPGDVVFVPDATELLVYVLGEVANPGVYPLQPNMTLVDAIARAGGWSPLAKRENTRLLRPLDGSLDVIDFKELEAGEYQLDVALLEGDIVFVPRGGLANWSYFWRSINPFAGAFSVGGG